MHRVEEIYAPWLLRHKTADGLHYLTLSLFGNYYK
jgi:hypothetical protein